MTTHNTTDEHWKRWFVQCSEHMQEVRAAELLREAQGGLQHQTTTSVIFGKSTIGRILAAVVLRTGKFRCFCRKVAAK